MFLKATNRQRVIAIIIFLSIVLYFTAFALAGRADVNLGRHLGYCGFKQRTNLPCPTCGMTTATLAFAQGKIFQSFTIQPAAGLLYCLTIVAAVLALFVAISGLYPNFVKRFFAEIRLSYIIMILVIVLATGWGVTIARALATWN